MRISSLALYLGLLVCTAGNASLPEALKKFGESRSFRRGLEELPLEQSKNLTNHLVVSGLTYRSTDDLMQQIDHLIRERSDSPLALEHLRWLGLVIDTTVKEFPNNQSLKRAQIELNQILESRSGAAPREALTNLVRGYLNTHVIEAEILKKKYGLDDRDPSFDSNLYQRYLSGDLDDSLKRFLLGHYLRLQTIFSPTIRQIRESATRLRAGGSGKPIIRVVRDYHSPGTFIRNGRPFEDDFVHIAAGNMNQRLNQAPSENPLQTRMPKIERHLVMLIDVTSSMFTSDKRGILRNLVAASYVDQTVSEANRRGERINLHLIRYSSQIESIVTLRSLEDAKIAFRDLEDDKFFRAGTADHNAAVIEAVNQIMAGKASPSHLNIVILTDGEEKVDVEQAEKFLNRVAIGPEGMRVGITAISLVKGHRTIDELTRLGSSPGSRVATQEPVLQHFSLEEVEVWTGEGWKSKLSGHTLDSTWRPRREQLSRLRAALRAIDFNERHELRGAESTGAEQLAHNDEGASVSISDIDSEGTPEEGSEGTPEEAEVVDREHNKSTQQNPSKNLISLNNEVDLRNITPEESSDSREVFRLRLIKGSLPPMLFLATNNNLPAGFSGIFEALGNGSLLRVRVQPKVNQYDLEITSLKGSLTSGGKAPIAKPEGYRLVSIEIFDSERKPVHDFEVFEITHNGLYIIDFKGPTPISPFTYRASYVKSLFQQHRSPHYSALDQKALLQVSDLLNAEKFYEDSTRVAKLASRNVKIEELAESIQRGGIYSFRTESRDPPPIPGPFATFQKFLEGNKRYMMCVPSAHFFAHVLNVYAKEANVPLASEVVGGYMVEELVVRGLHGHAVTFIRDFRIPLSYMKLDVTPSELDVHAKEILGSQQSMLSAFLRRYVGTPLLVAYERVSTNPKVLKLAKTSGDLCRVLLRRPRASRR